MASKILLYTLMILAICSTSKGTSDFLLNENALEVINSEYEEVKQNDDSKWLSYEDKVFVFIYLGGGESNSKVASFDIGDTVIKPILFSENKEEWKFVSDWISVRIEQETRNHKARLVFFANQDEVLRGITEINQVKKIVESMTKKLNIPCVVLIASENSEFSKPEIGLFELYEQAFSGVESVDKEKSFYCGDAIGETGSDKVFSQKLRLPFVAVNDFLLTLEPKLITDEE